MISITVYRNKRNTNKFLEVHSYFDGHQSVRQYLYGFNYHKNYTGDGCLHRIRKPNLVELISDYDFVSQQVISHGTICTEHINNNLKGVM